MPTTDRKLRVFLCHASQDKPIVRELYQQLNAEGWIDPWLDEEKLLPGHDWDMEIENAIRKSDVIVICLSKKSVSKEGYVQKEIKRALDIADEKPEGTIYLIPAKLGNCDVPLRLSRWQWTNLFDREGYEILASSLKLRANSLNINSFRVNSQSPSSTPANIPIRYFGGIGFVKVPAGKFIMGEKGMSDDILYRGKNVIQIRTYKASEKPLHDVDIPYDYWIARFPVTTKQYFTHMKMKKNPFSIYSSSEEYKENPVIDVGFSNALAYCKKINNVLRRELPKGFVFRLPTEAEWEKAARGENGNKWPWSNKFDKDLCNTVESNRGGITPVGIYSPQGDSPYGCADMVGNVWEWTHSISMKYPYNSKDGRESTVVSGKHILRGGSFNDTHDIACCTYRGLSWSEDSSIEIFDITGSYRLVMGFRVAIAPPLSWW